MTEFLSYFKPKILLGQIWYGKTNKDYKYKSSCPSPIECSFDYGWTTFCQFKTNEICQLSYYKADSVLLPNIK